MSMVVACAGYQDGRRVANLDVARCGSFLDGAGRFVWIGLYEPSEELLRTVQRQFGLHDLAVEDAFRAHQRPKVDVYGDAIFMVLRTARLIDAEIEFGETHVFAGKGYIISVRHGATSSYKEVRDRCESTPRMLENGEGLRPLRHHGFRRRQLHAHRRCDPVHAHRRCDPAAGRGNRGRGTAGGRHAGLEHDPAHRRFAPRPTDGSKDFVRIRAVDQKSGPTSASWRAPAPARRSGCWSP
jgi:hypothetical protein